MSRHAGVAAASLAVAVLASCGTGIAALSTTAGCDTMPNPTTGTVRTTHSAWNPEQLGNAAAIVDTGQALDIPARGQTIAVATAMQESSLRNLPYGDRDSLGLFQQRPSQGWGTPDQLTNPTYAATAFYTALLTIPAWQTMPLTNAAQAVQRSATPTAYATWEPDATTLITAVDTPTEPCIPTCPTGPPDTACAEDLVQSGLPDSYTIPLDTEPAVATAIAWALDQLGTPYHFGGDCTDPHSANPAHHCDCSSLTQQAYHHAGIGLPRTADTQSRTGTPVPHPDQLRPGDLLFIPGATGTPTHPGHVGLYLGDHLILHAPHTGATVHISQLSTHWTTNLTIRRIVRLTTGR